MEIIKWLSDPMSAYRGEAIVKLEPGETVTMEDLLALIDGDSVGHFGLFIELVSTEGTPEVYKDKRTGALKVRTQFGFPCASELRKLPRFYRVTVLRD